MKKTKNRLITFINDSELFFLEDVKDASSSSKKILKSKKILHLSILNTIFTRIEYFFKLSYNR